MQPQFIANKIHFALLFCSLCATRCIEFKIQLLITFLQQEIVIWRFSEAFQTSTCPVSDAITQVPQGRGATSAGRQRCETRGMIPLPPQQRRFFQPPSPRWAFPTASCPGRQSASDSTRTGQTLRCRNSAEPLPWDQTDPVYPALPRGITSRDESVAHRLSVFASGKFFRKTQTLGRLS